MYDPKNAAATVSNMHGPRTYQHRRSEKYYVPHGSPWPIVGSVGAVHDRRRRGAVAQPRARGPVDPARSACCCSCTCSFGWFGVVIRESESRLYNEAVDRSFRMGMMWFIFSEVMFFAGFFGALLYARQFSVPWLGGEGTKLLTKVFLRRQLRGCVADRRPRRHRRRLRRDPGVRPAGDQHGDPADLGRHDHDRASRAQGRQSPPAEHLPRATFLLGFLFVVPAGPRVHRTRTRSST